MMSILAILFACVVSSCSKDDSTDNPLVGKWCFTADYGDDSIEFLPNGKGIWYDSGYTPIKYRYSEGSQTLLIFFSDDDYDSYSEVNWDNIDNTDCMVFSVKLDEDAMQWFGYDDEEGGETYYYGTLIRVDKFPYYTNGEDD